MRTVAALAILSTLAAFGCGSDAKPPPQTPVSTGAVSTVPPQTPVSTDAQKPSDNPSQSNIQISDEIKKACGISDSEAFFAFNSANVREQDRAVLKKLADCFMTGPLKGRALQLVGHADPRGDEEYNVVLGGRRADNVKAAIANAGLTASQIATTSRGALDATGTDEASWAKDRRVDVTLGK
jgi:peptidoglycan-associated lipoprotein